MSLATRMKATASSLLTKYGETVFVVRENGSFNPSTGVMGSTSPVNYSGVGYPSNYRKSDVDGDIIRRDDTLLIFSSVRVPELNDVFTVSGRDKTALDIQIITVSGTNVLYKIQLR